MAKIADYPITHGWLRPYSHPQLGVEVNGQSAVRYMRFLQPVSVDYLELKPLLYGRWVPGVPTHPAHLTISTFNPAMHQWVLLRDVELPPDPTTSGEGLHQSMSIELMEQRLAAGLERVHHIDLGGIRTDLLRVECDREHPYWPNHGECNGGPYNVPYGILNTLAAYGQASEYAPALPEYLAPLRPASIRPRGTRGLKAEAQPGMVYFESRHLSVGFSTRRPLIRHLGWDAVGGKQAHQNRVAASQAHAFGTGFALSGPNLRTFYADRGPHNWTGDVTVEGNHVTYHNLTCASGVSIDAIFTVEVDRILLELTQTCDRDVPALEAEAWRLVWDAQAGMTGAVAVPTLRSGRNGEVELPLLWAGDGNGCLGTALLDGPPGRVNFQVESHRASNAVTGGIVLAARPSLDECLTLPAGRITTTWEWRVTNLAPKTRKRPDEHGEAIARHWASVYTCYRPEFGGFSNNAVSVNCHVNQHCPSEIVAFTQRPSSGPDPMDLYRFTIGRALMDGGGYGYFRNLYLDSDAILLSAAGRIYQCDARTDWLHQVEPGLRETTQRVLHALGDAGVALCHDLSGNSGSFRWSSNAADVIGFGHMDAYVNAWTYRALRNATALWQALGNAALANSCDVAAKQLRQGFLEYLVNPETGWVAGWRSRDGDLHDAAYLWVNGVAIAFGLLDAPAAALALRRLEALRQEVGAEAAHYGVPFNLWPIPQSDHMLPRILGLLAPTYEHYTDGAMAACAATYYLRALQIYGLKQEAQQIAAQLEEGYTRGYFNGGVGTGVEFRRWDGVPTGYEGTFVANFGPLYAIAIQRGLIKPLKPEWWPEA
ncbi:MAG: hypothetical protein M1546_13165 [Chloroflexi bacterium]|nr:hypothetical protein [Chloroflexota bacterium]